MTVESSAATAESQHHEWSRHLQRRVMRLLLLHHERLFHGHFRDFYAGSDLPVLPIFLEYDRFLKLRLTSDELFGDILPRIRRQLSLQTEHARLIETAPTRGNIDWPRTMQRAVHTTPGLPPIEFATRLRRRHTATPENLFTVVVLVAYRNAVRQALAALLPDEALSDEERYDLAAGWEQAERELGVPYAQALIERAQAIAANERDLQALARTIASRLRPGVNPYRDLLHWWERFIALRIGRGNHPTAPLVTSRRDDEKTDAWLYELWIMLELLHLLDQQQVLQPLEIKMDRLGALFRWRDQPMRIVYNRQHDDTGGADAGWRHGPGVRPDYTVERVLTGDQIPDGESVLCVKDGETLIWREPPIVLDAKYYLKGNDPQRTHEPIKKMLGDLRLLGASQGMLFFSALPEPQPSSAITRTVEPDPRRHHGGFALATQIDLCRLAPDMPVTDLHARLGAVLDRIAAQLAARPTHIRCHGVCLDADTQSPAGEPASGRIICPKPHIGAGVIDLVDRTNDCLKNPQVCHVIGQPIIPPFVVRTTTQAELQERTQDLRRQHDAALTQHERDDTEAAQALAEQLRAYIFTGIGRTIEQYVKIRGNTAMIEEQFERWVFGHCWRSDPAWALAAETRAMLLSGEYVWQEYAQQTGLQDWAAPAIQYCRALERELKRRFFLHAPKAFKVGGAGWTLGTPVHAIEHHLVHPNARINLGLMHDRVAPEHHAALDAQLVRLKPVHWLRNRLAHGEAVNAEEAQRLRNTIIGTRTEPGVLCWIAEHAPPAAETAPMPGGAGGAGDGP